MEKIKFASLIVTYRCNAKCKMCNTWMYPSKVSDEIDVKVFEKLPKMKNVNITGGEPFLRDDLEDIVKVLKKRSSRIVISTNGFLTNRILKFASKNKDVGIRISIEGFPSSNDFLRGLPNGFERGLTTLVELHNLGLKDIGFGITISDANSKDLLKLYHLAKIMGLEFATAAVHNSFYFHKYDNRFETPEIAIEEFKKLIKELLHSNRVKDWFRAYFNFGLINYIKGNPRLLPCEMGHDSFFLDPYGEIFPCNVMEESMGNLRERSFSGIWNSPRAEEVRKMVKNCKKNCWMIGSVAQQMEKYIWKPGFWILKHKFLGKEICV